DESVLKNKEARDVLSIILKKIDEIGEFSEDNLTNELKKIIKESGMETRNFLQILRLSTTGRDYGPEIVKIMKILGKDKCKRFIESVLSMEIDD
ncbi:MAG: hypothetical protein HWN67_23300, partial [Candidatus Helarchaeota archaeon]|nr:hypothetical protein [Candidatus Helarchaeota archaeon]